MTVRELLARTTSRELSEWAAYEQITGPLGAPRTDLHAGIVASAVVNALSGKARAKPIDFIPKWDRQPATPEDLFRKVQQLNRALKGDTIQRVREG